MVIVKPSGRIANHVVQTFQQSHLGCLAGRREAVRISSAAVQEDLGITSKRGGAVRGKTLLIVEDVVTSGGQILQSAADLRNLGAAITDVLCVIDRESGGAENLVQHGLALHALFTMSELKDMASGA